MFSHCSFLSGQGREISDMKKVLSSAAVLAMVKIKPLIKLSYFKGIKKIITLFPLCTVTTDVCYWRCLEQMLCDIIVKSNR